MSTTSIASVEFHGQTLLSIQDDDGNAFVSMRPIVEGMGLSWPRQFRKLNENKTKFKCCHMATVAEDGKNRELVCIPLSKLNAWLFSVNPEKVRKDIRPDVIRYQEECAFVLYEYWTKGQAVNPRMANDAEPRSLPRLTTAAERNGLAVMVNQIMGAQGPTTPGYQKFWRTLDAALGINHIDELTIDRLEPTVNLVKMLLDFVTGRQSAIASRPTPLTLLEPVSDSIQDRIEAAIESLNRGDKAYSDFLYGIRREVQDVIHGLVAEVNDGPAPAMERHAFKGLTEELARTFADQSHSHMCAGNALRPTLRSLIQVASVCRHRVPHIKALPAGKPRGRTSRKALTA